MVDGNNQIVTRNASNVILNGITKLALTELADIHRYKVVEKPFTVDEAINAKELFVTSAAIVTPITQLNNHVIADGKVGPISAALRSAYLERALSKVKSMDKTQNLQDVFLNTARRQHISVTVF